jgi:methionine synthase II (cobalamin-independent)
VHVGQRLEEVDGLEGFASQVIDRFEEITAEQPARIDHWEQSYELDTAVYASAKDFSAQAARQITLVARGALLPQGDWLLVFDDITEIVSAQRSQAWTEVGLTCTTAVHICYGYGIQANVDWKNTLGQEWRQYEKVFPALAKSSIDQVSLECMHSHVPMDLIALLKGKDVMVGVIDVASEQIETPEEVADTIGKALQFVAKDKLFPCTNCGLAPMSREVALKKLEALAKGAALARARL